MNKHRSWIYAGFIALWGLSALALAVHSDLSVGSTKNESRMMIRADNSVQSGVTNTTNEPFSVLIYREPKGKRRLEPQADCSEWQVIYRWARVAC
jgi:hypothetical protein